MALRDDIRDWVLVQGHSQRAAAKHFGIARDTVARLLAEAAEPTTRSYHRRTPRQTPVADVVVPHIERWLAQNEHLKRSAPKQCWTAHRMWTELQRMGIAVAESTVRLLVRQRKRVVKEVFVPLTFDPGERAEFDFGHAVVIVGGEQQTLPFLAGRLRYSGALFVEFFPTERTEAFLLGQRHAFEAWGGVPAHCVYDNTKTAVKTILRGRERVEHEPFRHFHTYYVFAPIFAMPAKGNEKGSVENLVGDARRNFMVPLPSGDTIADLNARLWQQCLAHLQTTRPGREASIMTLLEHERQYLRPLPERPLDVAIVREVLANSTARVRFETNQYSVPTEAAYAQLRLHADPFHVRIYHGTRLLAEHPRSYARNQIVEDWRHYLSLLERKPGSVPFAAPLRHTLPARWEAFRKELVARRIDGNREFVRVLQLCQHYGEAEVGAAMDLAAAAGSYSADAIQQLLGWAHDAPATVAPLDPKQYPQYQLAQPDAALTIYNRLLEVRP